MIDKLAVWVHPPGASGTMGKVSSISGSKISIIFQKTRPMYSYLRDAPEIEAIMMNGARGYTP